MWTIPSTITSHEALAGLGGCLLALTSIVVPLRFYARARQKASFALDDWLIVPSFLTFLALVACIFSGINEHDLGYPAAEVAKEGSAPKANVELILTINIASTLCFGFTRLSALFFYRRIFCVSDRMWGLKSFIHTMAILVVLWVIAFVCFPFAACGDHFSAYWIHSETGRYCPTLHPYLLSSSVTDTAFELIILSLPIPPIWKLNASIRKRAAVSFVFLTAIVSLGASVARLAIVVRLYVSPITDAALANSGTYFMLVLEGGFALIAVNMPTLYYLKTAIAPERMLASMRSAVSLTSLRSKHPKDYGKSRDLARESSTERFDAEALVYPNVGKASEKRDLPILDVASAREAYENKEISGT